MTTDLNFVKDDNNHVVELIVKAEGVAVDLTGVSDVDLILSIDGTTHTIAGVPDVDQVANTGQVAFTVTSTHLAAAGSGRWEVQVTAGSDIHTYPTTNPGKVRVRADLS